MKLIGSGGQSIYFCGGCAKPLCINEHPYWPSTAFEPHTASVIHDCCGLNFARCEACGGPAAAQEQLIQHRRDQRANCPRAHWRGLYEANPSPPATTKKEG